MLRTNSIVIISVKTKKKHINITHTQIEHPVHQHSEIVVTSNDMDS